MGIIGGVRVEGLRALVKDLESFGADIDDLKDVFAKIAKLGAEKAAGYAPKRTGALAGTVRGNRAKNKAVVAAGRSSVRYAGAINYGWPRRGIRASSFMQKADRDMQEVATAELVRGINTAMLKRGL